MKKNPILLILSALLLLVTACAPPAVYLLTPEESSSPTVPQSTVSAPSSSPVTEGSAPSTVPVESQVTASTAQTQQTDRPTETTAPPPITEVTGSAETAAPTETAAAHTHSYRLSYSREKTCTADGEALYSCSCGDSYTQVSKATGHVWGQWTVVLEPTATAEGISQRSCQNCPASETQAIEMLPPAQTPEVLEISEGVLQEIADGFLRLVNEERSRVGVGALTIDNHLSEAARIRSTECITSFSHTRPNGTPFHTTIDRQVYPFVYVGENICKTTHVGSGSYTDADKWVGSPEQIEAAYTQIFVLFKNSSGHYANMINEGYESCGIGIAYIQDPASGLPMFYVAHIFGAI